MNRLSYCVDNRRFAQLGFECRGGLARGIGDTVAMLSGAVRAGIASRRHDQR